MSYIFDQPRSKPAKRLEKLHDESVNLRLREREVGAEAQSLHREVERLREVYVSELAREEREGQSDAPRVAKRIAEAEATANEAATRIAAIGQASREVQAEVARLKQEHLSELEAELRPQAEAARQRLEQALQEVVAAARGWEATASQFGTLLRDTGTAAHVSGLGLESLIRDARQAASRGVAAPLPREAGSAPFPVEEAA